MGARTVIRTALGSRPICPKAHNVKQMVRHGMVRFWSMHEDEGIHASPLPYSPSQSSPWDGRDGL